MTYNIPWAVEKKNRGGPNTLMFNLPHTPLSVIQSEKKYTIINEKSDSYEFKIALII